MIDHLLSLVYVYPFRCQLCTQRFRTVQWGVRYHREPVDQRLFERLVADLPVTFGGDGTHGEGTVTDISIDGCGVRTKTPMAKGTLVLMELQTSEGVVTIETAVARSQQVGFMGVQFIRLQPRERERLSEFIQGLLAARRD